MSFQQHKWTRWLVQRSQESWKLMWQGIREPHKFRQTLVEEAQQSQNRTALSLLRTQKEWNDMRYYGFVPYMRQRIPIPATMAGVWPQSLTAAAAAAAPPSSPFGTTTDAGVAGTASSALSTAPLPTAKVAFMVTGRMKGELSDLGYSADDIKQLTPVEASLLIDNNVSPSEKAQKLPDLVKEYEEEQAQAKQQQEQAAEAAAAAEQVSVQTPSSDAPPSLLSTSPQDGSSSGSSSHSRTADSRYTPPPRTPSSSGPSLTEKLLGSIASENVIDKPVEIASRTHLPSSSHRDWYEVVEEYPNAPSEENEEVVALHSTEEEAEVDANLRHEIVTKRAQAEDKDVKVKYSIRKTTR